MANHKDQRQQLDLLFAADAAVSFAFGTAALVSPHGLLQKILGGEGYVQYVMPMMYRLLY